MLAIIGVMSFLASLILAFAYNYNHFYEFLLLGLFMILLYLLRGKIRIKTYVILYAVFIPLGIMTDLIIGISIFNLWHYTYSHIYEYIILYYFIYPLGGIIMVQSYLFFMKIIKTRNKNFRIVCAIFLSAYINGVIHEYPNVYAGQWIYTNWLYQNIDFLGIPISVLLFGWLFLAIVPISAYYFIEKFILNSQKGLKSNFPR